MRGLLHTLALSVVLLAGLTTTGCPDAKEAQKKAVEALRQAADDIEEIDLDLLAEEVKAEVKAEIAKTITKENALKLLKAIEAELEADIAAEAAEAEAE